MLHIKLKGIMQQHGSNFFLADNPLPTRPYGMGSKVIIHFFQNMVMLHIKLKKNHECSNMVSNILHADPPPPHQNLGMGQLVKFQFFQHMFMVHIKFKGIMNAATWSQMFCLQTPPPRPLTLVLGSKGQNSTFRTRSCFIAN